MPNEERPPEEASQNTAGRRGSPSKRTEKWARFHEIRDELSADRRRARGEADGE